MYSEIIRSEPGACPKCGMALELRTVLTEDVEENTELTDMMRRFRISVLFSVPLIAMAMGEEFAVFSLQRLVSSRALPWVELGLATPVVLWGAWPFFARGWQSVINRSINMFTLIGLGVAVVYAYSDGERGRNPYQGRSERHRARTHLEPGDHG